MFQIRGDLQIVLMRSSAHLFGLKSFERYKQLSRFIGGNDFVSNSGQNLLFLLDVFSQRSHWRAGSITAAAHNCIISSARSMLV